MDSSSPTFRPHPLVLKSSKMEVSGMEADTKQRMILLSLLITVTSSDSAVTYTFHSAEYSFLCWFYSPHKPSPAPWFTSMIELKSHLFWHFPFQSSRLSYHLTSLSFLCTPRIPVLTVVTGFTIFYHNPLWFWLSPSLDVSDRRARAISLYP